MLTHKCLKFRKNVLHTLHQSLFPKVGASICDAPRFSLKSVNACVFGIRLCALERDRLLMHTRTSHCIGKAGWDQHSSENLHVSVQDVSNELTFECVLAQRQCMHACDASGVCPCFILSFFATYLLTDGMNMSVETVLNSNRWQVPESKSCRVATPSTTESAKPLKSGSKDVIFKQEQPWDTPTSPKSSWQAVGEPDAPTWMLLGTQGTFAFWEISGAPLLAKKKKRCVQLCLSKATWFISWSSEIAVLRRGNIIRLRCRRLIQTRWFYCVGDFGTACGRH